MKFPIVVLKENKLKIAIVVMVYNPYHYLSEFLVHHQNLVDHIYVVDHRSSKKLSDLDLDEVTVIESKQVAQFQSEVTNAVIRDFNLSENYDWIFVLDIDEFLPFYSKMEFMDFLETHRENEVIAFNWRNGVGIYPTTTIERANNESLIDITPLLISDYINPNIKVAVNCNRLNYPFYFRTGAHEVVKQKSLRSILQRNNKYKTIFPDENFHFIYHIVSFDRPSFYSKIKNYVEQMELRKHVQGQGGWMVSSYLVDFSDQDWLSVIQNFRVTDEKKSKINVTEDDFSRIDIFSHLLLENILNLKARILNLRDKVLVDEQVEESEYLKHKISDSDVKQNLERFHISKHEDKYIIDIILR